MWQTLLNRLVGALGALFLLSLVTFSMVRLLPGNVSDAVLGEDASREAREALIAEYGLDKPLPAQYLIWLSGVLRGDFGYTAIGHQPVLPTILARAEPSLSLAAGGILIAIAVALPLGIWAGLHRNSALDRAVTTLAVITAAVPDFVIGLILILFVALNVSIFPVFGYAPLSDGLWEWGRHVFLPALTLSALMIGLFTRLTRSAVADTLQQEYVRTAYGKGLTRSRILFQHIIRPSLIPLITTAGLYLVAAIAGVVVVEVVFAIPGVGRLIVDSIVRRDYALVQGVTLLIGAWAVVVSFAVDVAYRLLDPRVRSL